MIRAEVADGRVVLVGDLPPNSAAYVDVDWLPSHSEHVPAIVAEPNREMGGVTGLGYRRRRISTLMWRQPLFSWRWPKMRRPP